MLAVAVVALLARLNCDWAVTEALAAGTVSNAGVTAALVKDAAGELVAPVLVPVAAVACATPTVMTQLPLVAATALASVMVVAPAVAVSVPAVPPAQVTLGAMLLSTVKPPLRVSV